MELNLTADAEPEDFTPALQDAFRLRLASYLNANLSSALLAVLPTDITLLVAAGSIHIQATVLLASPAAVQAATQRVAALTPDTASALTQLSVTSVSSPTTREVAMSAPPPPPLTLVANLRPSPSGGAADSAGLIAGAAVGGVALALALVALLALRARNRAGPHATPGKRAPGPTLTKEFVGSQLMEDRSTAEPAAPSRPGAQDSSSV